jgi:lactose/L-arabinose transport system substrate-binding protein
MKREDSMFQRTSRLVRTIAATLAGVSLLSVAAASAGEVTVWTWDPNFNGASMTKAGEIYAKDHPDFKLTVVDFAKADLETKLQAQLASGTTDGLPDIVLIEDYGAQKYLQSFPGAFEPLSGQVDYSKFAPYKVELATVNGQTYSLPFDAGTTAFFYRSKDLEEAGYTAADLENITWDRLIEIGLDVKAKTGKILLPIDPNDGGIFRIMLQSAGSWYFDADGNVNLADNAVFKKALATYQKLLASGITKPVAGWTEYTGSFTSGDTLGTVTGVWMVGTIKANADQAGEWGIAPTPSLDIEGGTNASNLGGSSWYVLSSAPNKAEAVDFLKTVWGENVDFYQDILVNQGAVGSLTAAREGAAYSASDDFFGGAPVWQNFSDWLAAIPAVNYGIFTAEADSAVVTNLPALTSGGNVDEVAAAIDAQARQAIQ